MTATNGQTGTGESTGTAQAAPPPFHVPAGSACVDDCDDAPLGWSTPAVGAANLPAQAQGGEGDMIGCWQVARTTDPHGDSETSDEDEIMQLYVSADGAGGNSGGAEYDTAEQRGGTHYAIQNTESAGSHTHAISGSSGSAGGHSHGVTGRTGLRGGGQPHDNIPPYASVLACIKT